MSLFERLPRPTKTYHNASYERIEKGSGFDGDGKTVLITGGASGIGFSISRAFAEAGVARIAIVSRSAGPQEKAKTELEAAFPSTQILTYQASVTDSSRISEILQELGTVDVFVLSAALVHRRVKAVEISTQEIQDAFDTNTMAVFNLTQAYLAMPLPASGRKTIINLSSAVVQVSGTLRIGYGSSKAAAAQLLQHFASELRDCDYVRIFSFHPGAFYTPEVAQHFAKDEMKWDDLDLPAHFAVWLAGPESDFLYGRHLWANWDVDELIALKDRLAKDPSFLTIGLVL
ncbi:putative NADP(+)-dependent dehydrogenase [Delphinella strobiligena]|nr:putative NADP(+)-dependent dehydrogenase [Delphinella strobiligena]